MGRVIVEKCGQTVASTSEGVSRNLVKLAAFERFGTCLEREIVRYYVQDHG